MFQLDLNLELHFQVKVLYTRGEKTDQGSLDSVIIWQGKLHNL